MEDAPYTVTLKAGSSMDSPWIIVKAETPQQLVGRLRSLEQQYVAQQVSRMALDLQDAYDYEGKHRGSRAR